MSEKPTFAEFMTAVFGACLEHRHEQVGRCVYCAECNRRLYQGTVMSLKDRTELRDAGQLAADPDVAKAAQEGGE